MKLRIGILMGGPSREREISFAGGRTVYDNLDKTLYDPVPLFVDAHKQLIIMEWPYIYKGSIRDFYPPVSYQPQHDVDFQIYEESLPHDTDFHAMRATIGTPITWSDLADHIDFAFLCLHGSWGEDGQLQGLLESLDIPYSGAGIRSSAIGIDKKYQKQLMQAAGYDCPRVMMLDRSELDHTDWPSYRDRLADEVGFPLVVRPASQGSSLGVSILDPSSSSSDLQHACEHAFFRQRLSQIDWNDMTDEEQISYVQTIADIREGIGMPVWIHGQRIDHPADLLQYLRSSDKTEIVITSSNDEHTVLLEEFIEGREFSCIVLDTTDGDPISLPPTEIVKSEALYDYKSKYLPGLARKRTPIDMSVSEIEKIQAACKELYAFFGFEVYARIDGFIQQDGQIYLNDPNTTSGMLPSSFFFHQAAEIGLSPSQFISYIIQISLLARSSNRPADMRLQGMIEMMQEALSRKSQQYDHRIKVGVIFGGYSTERHISVESGRNIYEKLNSSDQYHAIPIFLTGDESQYTLHQLPINLLLKDNADDIAASVHRSQHHPIAAKLRQRSAHLLADYIDRDAVEHPVQISLDQLQSKIDFAFIALHGRPGEDGKIQRDLEDHHIAYNGSDAESSATTINKYQTLQHLRAAGFPVTQQLLYQRSDYLRDPSAAQREIEKSIGYPMILKPVDDGCSSAVLKITNSEELAAYLAIMFGDVATSHPDHSAHRESLSIDPKEEFPQKDQVLIESLITASGADQFMEVTVGVLTQPDGDMISLTPSEALSSGAILSLEEKFLAGEGQNLTPARFGTESISYERICTKVQSDILHAAKTMKVEGYARIDAFVRVYNQSEKIETIIIEINSLPGMTPATCIFHQAALEDLSPLGFIDRIIQHGMLRSSSVSTTS